VARNRMRCRFVPFAGLRTTKVGFIYPPERSSTFKEPELRWAPNFGVKLMRPGFGPAAELPTVSPA
jgi:hypothetical protein